MSGRPSLTHSLQPEPHPSARNDYAFFAASEDTDTSPSTPSELVNFDTHRDDTRDPRNKARITDQSANAKVAIPRLDLPVASSNGRVSRACHNCRKQKNKCSGERPSCQRCQEASVPCVYVDGKRERNAKHLTAVTSQLEQYESLVRDIYPKVDLEVARFVDQALGKISGLSLSSPTAANAPDDNASDDATTPVSVPCIEHTLEDFNGDISLQATGFLGEHSARAWLYRLKRLIASKSPKAEDEPDGPAHLSLASCGFFLDDSSISLGNGLDVLAYPTQAVADQLVDRYFKVAHATFPLVGKEIFLSQCRSFYSKSGTMQPGIKWMALLNIVFAIAAKHSEVTGDKERLDHNNDIVYFSRAWKLSMSDTALLEHPNLQQTQIEGLFSLYFLSTGQVNRAWRMCGVAIQSATTMGIHLRSDSSSITHVSKETRYRLWWALYSLDTLVCVMTGRMPRMQREHCTTPLPVPYPEESFWDEQVMAIIQDSQARASLVGSFLSNPSAAAGQPDLGLGHPVSPHQRLSPGQRLRLNVSSCLLFSIDLATVMRAAIDMLYTPEAAKRSGTELEQAMISLNNTADNWYARLPAAYHFTDTTSDLAIARQRTSLAFQYYSTKLVISQPALRFHTLDEISPHPVHGRMGAICFSVAAQMVDILPNDPNVTWLLSCSPWWCALHYLTQSTVVLITQLLMWNAAWSQLSTNPLDRIEKVLRWLSELSTRDAAFERAWLIFTELLSSQGFNVGLR
ncbi:unnamed protein product [Penicillium salamii]|uniref:Zn(2)-C6 fungal-type domain-containing protein n=1 Tax=Penicillium salamii TaxID=1612424 RepID=A0A9W4NLD0_9EURO|nr:unnamed protein product [Penicillium salamii]CAG8123953.1 unnamed protein product [Penicillium salamii]CAG8136941.1 unnamed protein product [Penicillium salamii]CAG8304378.1 unnamed protein product [Penicillium salamii]CAG8332665.1 unnamed protein product [Penicillium salamii]